jgi:hypothetical protein
MKGLFRRRVTYGIAVTSLAAAFGIAGIAIAADAPSRPGALPSVVQAVEQGRRGMPIPARLIPPIETIKLFPARYRIPRSCLPHNRTRLRPLELCRVGDPSSRKVLVVLGDSHAFMWLPAVQVLARRDGWAVVPLVRFGCTPEKWFTNMGPDGPICRTWLRWAIGEIRRIHPTVTLVGGSVGETPSAQTRAAAAGMIAAARALKPLGRLIVIGDPEGLSANPVPCVVAPNASMRNCTTTWPSTALAAYDTVARGTRAQGVGFLPTRGFVCYQRHCPAVVGKTIVWMDTNHLTGIYSAQVAGPFRAAFRRLLP